MTVIIYAPKLWSQSLIEMESWFKAMCKKKILCHLSVQFKVIHVYVLVYVFLIAGRRHFLYLLYLKDSSQQVIAFYLKHTVHHFCINRIGKYHFYINFFIHFCFTKYLYKENA